MKIKKYIPFMGPKFDRELNQIWHGAFFSWMNLHPEATLEDCVDAANKAARAYDKLRKEFTND